MARTRKLSSTEELSKTPAEDIFKTIIEDVLRAKDMPFEEWHALSQNPLIPLSIPVPPDWHYPATQIGIDAAHLLTQQTWDSREDLRQTFSRDSFNKASFNAIGTTINRAPSHLPDDIDHALENNQLPPDFYKILAQDYSTQLDENTGKVLQDLDRHIPCHLFHSDQKVPGFSIGPVQFRPRSEWVNHIVKDSHEKELISHYYDRKIDIESLEKQAINDRRASNAITVIRSLSSYPWVATIRMEKHEPTQSHTKASILVGLAMDVIGLRFHESESRRFTKAGRHHTYSENRIATSPKGDILHGWSTQMPGIGAKPGALSKRMLNEREFFNSAGYILQKYLDGRKTGKALHLVERWTNALYWFGEARRENSDFMAAVNYGCAIDALSGAGGDAKEIVNFAAASLSSGGNDWLRSETKHRQSRNKSIPRGQEQAGARRSTWAVRGFLADQKHRRCPSFFTI